MAHAASGHTWQAEVSGHVGCFHVSSIDIQCNRPTRLTLLACIDVLTQPQRGAGNGSRTPQ